jgi:3-hydroxyisobutyrate dehydrogenase
MGAKMEYLVRIITQFPSLLTGRDLIVSPLRHQHILTKPTTTMASKPKVAFIGLGAMGMGMAIHLLEDGFAVTGFDVNPMALERLLAMGGASATSPKECAQGASFVICMVANSTQTEDAFFADSTGAVFGLAQNATVILCSTVAPGFPVEILDRIHQVFQRPDIRLLDCPVSGGTIRAARGMLTILSSGPTDVLNTAQPILKSMSENLYEIEGGLGAANKVKLINQHLAGVHIAVSAEAMGLAATLKLNTKEFYETVLKSPACSWMFENRVPHMLSNDWTPHSAISIFVKDMVSLLSLPNWNPVRHIENLPLTSVSANCDLGRPPSGFPSLYCICNGTTLSICRMHGI